MGSTVPEHLTDRVRVAVSSRTGGQWPSPRGLLEIHQTLPPTLGKAGHDRWGAHCGFERMWGTQRFSPIHANHRGQGRIDFAWLLKVGAAEMKCPGDCRLALRLNFYSVFTITRLIDAESSLRRPLFEVVPGFLARLRRSGFSSAASVTVHV